MTPDEIEVVTRMFLMILLMVVFWTVPLYMVKRYLIDD